MGFIYNQYADQVAPEASPSLVGWSSMPPPGSVLPDGASLSRTQSAATASSESSEYTHSQISPAFPAQRMMAYNKSESDLGYIQASVQGQSHGYTIPGQSQTDTTPTSRQRSQSSPQIEPGMLSPSSGKAVKPSPLALQRQNSYHGSGSSPRRPMLSRANTSQLPTRRSRPGSLAASVFGITPLGGDDSPYSPNSPSASSGASLSRNGSISHSHTHSRARSDASSSLALTPFTTSMGVLNISPDVETPETASSMSSHQMPMPLAIPPLTPNTPLHAQGGAPTFSPDYVPSEGDHSPMDFVHAHVHPATQGVQAHAKNSMQYSTMPNRHYGQHQYSYLPAGAHVGAGMVANPATEHGQGQGPGHGQGQSQESGHGHAQTQTQTQTQTHVQHYNHPQSHSAPIYSGAPVVDPTAYSTDQIPAHSHSHSYPQSQTHDYALAHTHAHSQAHMGVQVMTDFGPAPGQYHQQWQ